MLANDSSITEEEKRLIDEISKTENSEGTVARTVLKTDDRVIARVTDGIYRQPGSALRELISNAYDADATKVVIKTDAPRFDEISVEDNGIGMTKDTLARTLLHIGGSAKRHTRGQELGITDSDDSQKSPSGRPLIGKIGIGMFSVSQLTQTFQIITKVKGESFRTVATVSMRQYSDNGENDDEFESGKVNIWREPATDVNVHGTTIILTGIKPHAKNLLRSAEMWAAVGQSNVDEEEGTHSLQAPKYHIGKIGNSDSNGLFENEYAVPWDKEDNSQDKFSKLVDSVWREYYAGNNNPQLEKLFDNYLNMIWQLSLSIPISYVAGHPFDLDMIWTKAFELSNSLKGGATDLAVEQDKPIRQILNLQENSIKDTFEVIIDDLKLSRPIKFRDLPQTSHAIKQPLIFFGKCREEFSGIDRNLSGGPLSFEAYLFWTPKIAPTEHRGSLIRIHGASGSGFDSTFMRYQTSEQTRRDQVTCEIFIQEGFDSALNIDRESFNYAHPHAVFLTKWLHSAFRQLATAQKRVAKGLRDDRRIESTENSVSKVQQIALTAHKEETRDDGSNPLSIEIIETGQLQFEHQRADVVYEVSAIIPEANKRQTTAANSQNQLLNEKIKAIAQLLSTYGLLDKVEKSKQERLLKAIYQILQTSE